MHEIFEISDLGDRKIFLRMHIKKNREKGTLELNQKGYITKILDSFKMGDAKSMNTPMVKKVLKWIFLASKFQKKIFQMLIFQFFF